MKFTVRGRFLFDQHRVEQKGADLFPHTGNTEKGNLPISGPIGAQSGNEIGVKATMFFSVSTNANERHSRRQTL